MPGSVQLCTVQGGATVALPVLPRQSSSSWSESHAWPVEQTDYYPDGSRQQKCWATTGPRRSWVLARNLNASDLADLRAFYVARKGVYPFYFYPLRADFDDTGASATGRYAVRFEGAFPASYGMGRHAAQLRLVEVV